MSPAQRRAHTEEPRHPAPNAALMIDFDNVTMGIRSDLQKQLRALLNSDIIRGKVAVQRAYADWRRYPQYIVPLSEASIDLIFAPAFGSNKKNATDIRLAIDALELVFTRPEIGTFILLSGDSDFSSLVLKLKEYGKWVIGVGLRESSSDLLVQNCDEYYSYTEVTGLAREGDIVAPRRDPWELVVDAITQMKRADDVMRSDRLKQVMQSIDPNFDEKDAGFSRFSKFVQEASQRGLVSLHKLENGQYGVDLGKNANVPPEAEAELRKPARESKPRGRSRGRGGERRDEREQAARELTLAESFELMRQALMVLEAVGEEATDANQVRDKMVELFGDDSDPVFDRGRFQRLLRQAHDAELIELVKDDEGYRLKLRPQALVPESTAEPTPEHEIAAEPAEPVDAPRPEKRSRGRGGPRGRARRPERKDEPRTTEPPSASAAAASGPASRGPRLRRGARGGPPAPAQPSDVQQTPVHDVAATRPAASAGEGQRSLGPRRGRRAGGAAPAPGVEPRPQVGKVADSTDDFGRPPASGPPGDSARLAESRRPAEAAPASPPPDDEAGGGLFRRMSAALQKVVRGAAEPPEGDG